MTNYQQQKKKYIQLYKHYQQKIKQNQIFIRIVLISMKN